MGEVYYPQKWCERPDVCLGNMPLVELLTYNLVAENREKCALLQFDE